MSRTVEPRQVSPAFWGALVFALAATLVHWLAAGFKALLEVRPDLTPPEVSAGPPLIYFFVAVAVLGVILALIPTRLLKLLLKALFVLLYCWGIFVLLLFLAPWPWAIAGAGIAGLLWFFQPRVWYHDLVLMLALVSVGGLFGRMMAPWTVMVLLGVISVYDVLSVSFGYMVWMARRLADLDVLPAFVFPKDPAHWNVNLKGEGFRRVMSAEDAERDFSILGGGDIGFPLILVSSVFFRYGPGSSVTVAGSALAGIIAAFWIQRAFLKGRPLPALPPITLASLAGLLAAYFWIA